MDLFNGLILLTFLSFFLSIGAFVFILAIATFFNIVVKILLIIVGIFLVHHFIDFIRRHLFNKD